MVGIITGLRQAGAEALCIHSMTNKAHLFRVLKLVLFMALVVGVFWHGLISPTARDAALLGVGYALVLTVGYDLVKRGLDLDRVVLIVGGLATVLGVAWCIWHFLVPPAREPSGQLLPANEPTPASQCRAAPGELVVAVGSNRVIASGNAPFVPFYAGSGPGPILTRTPRGLMITAFGYTWTEDIAYGIRDNQLQTDPLPGLHFFRPDPHTLVLLDRFEQEIIHIRYLNRDAVRIRGRFLCGENPQTVIEQDRVLMGGVRISGVMFGQRRTAGNVCARMAPGAAYGVRFLR